MAEFVNQRIESGVATLTLNRPDLHNAFNEQVIAEIHAAFDSVGRRDDVRAVVLAGEGKSFCAGADVHWMSRMVGYSFDENLADALTLANMLRAIHDCPKPVIARVHGAALGGGTGLVAACDMAVALESAIFGFTEARLGIIPAVISPFALHKIGGTHARRYFLTAERFGAAEAMRIGLISHVAGSVADMDAWIETIIKEIRSNGAMAVTAAKGLIDDVLACPWDQVADLTGRRIAERRVSAEGQEGLKSFLEKRRPSWSAPATGERA